mgnify:CR=1 FL=1
MALSDANVVDGLAVDDDDTLVMLISDGMGWEDEGEHLRLLGEKINGYAVFVSSGQWRGAVGADAARVTSFRIELKMAEPFGPRCDELLDSAARQIGALEPPVSLSVSAPGL